MFALFIMSRGASMADLYIWMEGGVVWAGVRDGSQVNDVAVQDLLVPVEKRRTTVNFKSTTTMSDMSQHLLDTFHRSPFLHVFSDASD